MAIGYQCANRVRSDAVIRQDLLHDDRISGIPGVHMRAYRDGFGNICQRLTAPAGRYRTRGEVHR